MSAQPHCHSRASGNPGERDADDALGARARGTVVTLSSAGRAASTLHEARTLEALARRLAALRGYAYAGEHASMHAQFGAREPRYFVPDDTLLLEHARGLGIATEDDLFGGIAPHAFVASKVVTHGLVAPDAAAPRGWSGDCAGAIAEVVLPGHAVFSREDARRAVTRLLPLGRLRFKPAGGIGGHGQRSISTMADLEACLEADAGLEEAGSVIELEIEEDVTYSIGQVRVADMLISYHGRQRQTRNHRGRAAYGGSELTVVRGPIETWLGRALPARLKLAIEQALQYDRAVFAAYPGLLASRRNYDVLQGVAPDGRMVSGVLEQSWRCGGATPAEIAALEAFRADGALDAVNAESCERYAEADPPPDAAVYFHGDDPDHGPMLKYGRILDGRASAEDRAGG